MPTRISASVEKFLRIAALASACEDILSAVKDNAMESSEINELYENKISHAVRTTRLKIPHQLDRVKESLGREFESRSGRLFSRTFTRHIYIHKYIYMKSLFSSDTRQSIKRRIATER